MDAEVNAELRRRYGISIAYPRGVGNPALDPNRTAVEHALYEDTDQRVLEQVRRARRYNGLPK